MRLLYVDRDGEFSLRTFHERNIPPYAILSHTWGADEDEVSFDDLETYSSDELFQLRELGYGKLQLCATKAAKDSLDYFWIDTCCIRKSSEQELSEAINSMFRWYQRAVVCYVYLSDIPAKYSRESFLSQSRWFTRGWTLQELIAPSRVEFYDRRGKFLGTKGQLSEEISHCTGIPMDVLLGRPLGRLSVEEGLKWAQYRQTKRGEDGAYSLLGIFGVSMPLIYGEGRTKAYHRLYKEVDQRSSGLYDEFDSRYGQLLPSTDPSDLGKAVGTIVGATPETTTMLPSSEQSIGQELQQTWDSAQQKWIQMQWSSQYQRHYRQHHVEGM
jgi:hypothetical protein